MSGAPVLSRRLVLETPQRAPDGAGGYVTTWAALGQLWAEVKAGTGRELADGLVTLSSVPLRITVRASPVGALSRPQPEQRFREGGRIFRILAVAEGDAQGRFLTCIAREEVLA